MKIQNHQPQREHWQLTNASGKVNFKNDTGVLSSQDLVKLTDKIPPEGTGAFYHFQHSDSRPSGLRTALTAVQSVGMAGAVGAAAGMMTAFGMGLLGVASLGIVEQLNPVLSTGVGLGLGLLVGGAATTYGMIAEEQSYQREGSCVYGNLRGEYTAGGEKELAFYPYAQGSERVCVTDYAQGTLPPGQTSWWLASYKNRI